MSVATIYNNLFEVRKPKPQAKGQMDIFSYTPPKPKPVFKTVEVPVVGKYKEGYDLNKDFDYLNNLLFNGEVKKPPKFIWKQSKSFSGHVGMLTTQKRVGRTKYFIETNITNLTMNSKIVWDRPHYLGVIAHEMVHMLMSQKDEIKTTSDYHGRKFVTYINDINKKIKSKSLPIAEVEKTDDVSKLEYHHDKLQNRGFIIVKAPGEKPFLSMVISEKRMKDVNTVIMDIDREIKRYLSGLTFTLYESTDPVLLKYPLARKFKINKFLITDKQLYDLLGNSKKLQERKSGR